MTRFADMLRSGPRRPGRVVTLPLTAWSETTKDRPAAPIDVGLRLPSELDIRRANQEGAEREEALGPSADPDDRTREFNSGVMVSMIAACTSLAVDASLPFFESYLEAEMRLSPDGVRLLWQELELLQISSSPALPELTDEGMSHLWAMWERGEALAIMPPEEAKKVRRALEWARQQLAFVEEHLEAGALAETG